MPQSKDTVAKVLLNQLNAWGVRRVYGVVGDAILGLLDELDKQSEIELIAVKHESVAAMMASAEAKLTGNLGVCIATMGPGLGNLINGLGDAYLDKTPVLAITGQAPTKKIGTDYKQTINQQELIKPLASYTSLLAHPDTITDLLVKAINTSLIYGAVSHLSIPKDLFLEPTNAKVQKKPIMYNQMTEVAQQDIEEINSIMKTAKQPMILAGVGSIHAVQEVIELSRRWGAGILVSLGAKGFFADETQTLVGGIGQGGNPYAKDLFVQSDVVLLVGDTWWPEGYVPANARIIQIDLKQENIGNGIPVEAGIVADVKIVIPKLLEDSEYGNETWLNQCLSVKDKWNQDNEKERAIATAPIHPSRIVMAIEQVVKDDAIITIDTGDVTVWMNRNFKPKNQQLLFSGKWRTMGFGLPAALAAKLTYPVKQVVAVVGDGGIEMTLADLLTAIKYNLGIIVVIFNNHALQMERDKMLVGGLQEEGVALTNPDFVGIATACGWKGYNVSNERQLDEVFTKAFAENGPTLVSVETAPVIHPETKK